MSAGVFLGILLLFCFFLVGVWIRLCLVVCPPGKAIFIKDQIDQKQDEEEDEEPAFDVVTGGRLFHLPFLQKVMVLDLSSIRVQWTEEGIAAKEQQLISLDIVIHARISRKKALLPYAAEYYTGNERKAVTRIVKEVAENLLLDEFVSIPCERISYERSLLARELLKKVQEKVRKRAIEIDGIYFRSVKLFPERIPIPLISEIPSV